MSLLDLHVEPQASHDGPPYLEILEAGTGAGGLTLHLARATHAANMKSLRSLAKHDRHRNFGQKLPAVLKNMARHIAARFFMEKAGASTSSQHSPYNHHDDERRAIIHSVDVSSKHSKAAKEMIQGFRQGMYLGDIEFHVGGQ